MNDIGYITCQFINSPCHTSKIGATKEQLTNARRNMIMAIEFHQKENNPGQVKFFQDGLNWIDKKLTTAPVAAA
jgi:hypothetical protein